jgi:hypothetical protein
MGEGDYENIVAKLKKSIDSTSEGPDLLQNP